MEFPGIGVIPYEAPPESLRPFFRKKYKVWFSGFATDTPGRVHRRDFMEHVEEVVKNVPADEQGVLREKMIFHWDHVMLCGKESITEEEILSEWLDNRVFTTPKQRKHNMELTKQVASLFFSTIDLDKDGKVDLSEWLQSTKTSPEATLKTIFDVIDVNKDGFLSPDEWLFAILYYHYCSGPDSVLSQLWGKVSQD